MAAAKILPASFLVLVLTMATAMASGAGQLAQKVDASESWLFGFRWRRPVLAGGGYRTVNHSFGSPAISVRHGSVLIATGEGDVAAFGLDDGRTLWVHSGDLDFESEVTLFHDDDGRELALVVSRDGTATAVDVVYGTPRWSVNLGNEVRRAARVSADRFVVSTVRDEIVAFARDGSGVIWTARRPAHTGLGMQLTGIARPVVGDGVVYAAFSDGFVAAFSESDGAQLWARSITTSDPRFSDADADPVLVGDTLVVGSYADGVYGLSKDDGGTRWRTPFERVTGLTATKDLVIAVGAAGQCLGLSPLTGRVQFELNFMPGPVSSPVVLGDLAVFTSATVGLIGVNTRTGKPIQATVVPGGAGGKVAWTGKHLALLSSRGLLYSFGLGQSERIR